ncbi:hypothetical protein SAMN04487996_11210 [Dyadobacter soli]|uniref:Uncharacterized protein n=1 Tax=Dyadobacter soli TaxID=659014 RepID=A0A1G7NCH3_9BACT|nr:hypothetical protein SAMN04487996_11210 [Dyadobacter soli]
MTQNSFCRAIFKLVTVGCGPTDYGLRLERNGTKKPLEDPKGFFHNISGLFSNHDFVCVLCSVQQDDV